MGKHEEWKGGRPGGVIFFYACSGQRQFQLSNLIGIVKYNGLG